MSRKSGRVRRFLSRLFKERQIYHRSDGVVHFISMSSRTQIMLASVILAALLWVAYASVNVVFKETIIVAKDKDRRELETAYLRQIDKQQRAYQDVDALNLVMRQEFEEEVKQIRTRHQTLQSMVERKATIDQNREALTRGLSEAGAPNGAKPTSYNRIMIDAAPAEVMPRQSRLSALRQDAIEESARERADVPANSPAAAAIEKMQAATADLYVEQMFLLASLEESAQRDIDAMRRVLKSTGLKLDDLIGSPKISNLVLAQGGPFIDISNVADQSTAFFHHANRVGLLIEELTDVSEALLRVPLSSPLLVSRNQTSGFGIRRDPFTGRAATHAGIDFKAAWASPIVATAPGTVVFAGVRTGFGKVVEVDHGNGFMTRYAHMSRVTARVGQRVKLHAKLGELGTSGRSTAPHLHYEVLYRGAARNPRLFIEAGRYVFES